uniref:Uncharacterized protein F3.2 n=1 Tax=viral metagenome TaxID=1070528 RepID=A0A445PPI7_9ZZZZ
MCLRAQHQNTYRSFARAKILHTTSRVMLSRSELQFRMRLHTHRLLALFVRVQSGSCSVALAKVLYHESSLGNP